MANFCFADRPRDLWNEANMRGFVAACRDYPHLLNFDEMVAMAHTIPGALRDDVCCIPGEYAYWHLIVYAWSYGYLALSAVQEHRIAQAVLAFSFNITLDEALHLARVCFQSDEAVYAYYQAHLSET